MPSRPDARSAAVLVGVALIAMVCIDGGRATGGGMTWPLSRCRARANGNHKQRQSSGQLRDYMQYVATKWA
jgi:hypothetical protein